MVAGNEQEHQFFEALVGSALRGSRRAVEQRLWTLRAFLVPDTPQVWKG